MDEKRLFVLEVIYLDWKIQNHFLVLILSYFGFTQFFSSVKHGITD